jgi:hypothetical protein
VTGRLVDFVHATFSVLSAKGSLIFGLLSSVLGAPSVHFTALESLVGKLGALALAAPGILMKLRRSYTALAVASRSPSTVLRVTGPLRDELRELASMHFWRAAVAPWMRPVHLIIVVSKNVIQGTTVRGRYAPGEVLVSYGFPN